MKRVLQTNFVLPFKRSKIIEEWRIEGLVTEVMGFLTPAPSLVTEHKSYTKDKKSATDYLYDLCCKSTSNHKNRRKYFLGQ